MVPIDNVVYRLSVAGQASIDVELQRFYVLLEDVPYYFEDEDVGRTWLRGWHHDNKACDAILAAVALLK